MLPAAAQDAYYELVQYEVEATANLYALRQAEFTNILYAAQGRAATNDLAATAEATFATDAALMAKFNTSIAGGKWKDFMIQPHIDYGDVARYGPNAPWQEPELNNGAIPDVIFPAVQRITLPAGAVLGVAIDGSAKAWPAEQTPAVLPALSPYQSQPAPYIDVFNRRPGPVRLPDPAGCLLGAGHAGPRPRHIPGAGHRERRLVPGASRHDAGADHGHRAGRKQRGGPGAGREPARAAHGAGRLHRGQRLRLDRGGPLQPGRRLTGPSRGAGYRTSAGPAPG